MISIQADNSELIDRIQVKIADATRNALGLANDPKRQHGERLFVIGYIQALLEEGLLSRDIAFKLIADLDEAWKAVTQPQPNSNAPSRRITRPRKT